MCCCNCDGDTDISSHANAIEPLQLASPTWCPLSVWSAHHSKLNFCTVLSAWIFHCIFTDLLVWKLFAHSSTQISNCSVMCDLRHISSLCFLSFSARSFSNLFHVTKLLDSTINNCLHHVGQTGATLLAFQVNVEQQWGGEDRRSCVTWAGLTRAGFQQGHGSVMLGGQGSGQCVCYGFQGSISQTTAEQIYVVVLVSDTTWIQQKWNNFYWRLTGFFFFFFLIQQSNLLFFMYILQRHNNW